jgi:CheY-like chemotaxis protein
LVIDDAAMARELLTRWLHREGYAVTAAASGEEGLERAREQRPSLITLDVLMPTMDGWSVLSSLKADPALAEIPVILLTMVESRELGRALGAVEYLVKPVDRKLLAEVLARHTAPQADAPILVVEDDAATSDLLRRTVESMGLRAVVAENGKVALERVSQRTPQLILLDLMMPEMDGFGFLAALWECKPWSRLPVVVVTAKELTALERAYLDGAGVEILKKGEQGSNGFLARVRAVLEERSSAA